MSPRPAPRMARYAQMIRDLASQPALLLWSLALFAFPLLRLGPTQPGVILSVVALPFIFRGWDGRLGVHPIRVVRALIYFLLWITAVNWSWALILQRFGLFGTDTFVFFPVPYAVNALIIVSALVLWRRFGERFIAITVNAVWVTALAQVALSFVVGGHGRGAILFNNPNQLGFYALLSASTIALAGRRIGMTSARIAIGMTACLFLSLLSASKAALAGNAVLLGLSLITNLRTFVLTALALALTMAIATPFSDALERTTARLSASDPASLYEGRGYDRIWDHKEYWVLGAGEGGLDRFSDTSVIGNHELHSSGGTVFFSYGIVGVLLFLAFLARIARAVPWRTAMLLVPPLAYGLAHQGLRTTLFWIFLALLVSIARTAQPARAAPIAVHKALA